MLVPGSASPVPSYLHYLYTEDEGVVKVVKEGEEDHIRHLTRLIPIDSSDELLQTVGEQKMILWLDCHVRLKTNNQHRTHH